MCGLDAAVLVQDNSLCDVAMAVVRRAVTPDDSEKGAIWDVENSALAMRPFVVVVVRDVMKSSGAKGSRTTTIA